MLADDAVRPRLWRATMPRGSNLPGWRYWNAARGSWGRFDEATRYPAAEAPETPEPPEAAAEVEWVEDLPLDLDGWPYRVEEGMGPWRATRCCAAACSISDGPLYCKSCYEAVDLAADTPARLDANWDPGPGPMRFRLPGTDDEGE